MTRKVVRMAVHMIDIDPSIVFNLARTPGPLFDSAPRLITGER